jgi:hypothetical protein
MKNKLSILLMVILLAAFLTQPVFAQSSTGRSRTAATFKLTVTANVAATVTITNPSDKGFVAVKGRTTLVQDLAPGRYNVRVEAPGYLPQTKTINFSANQSLNYQLQPALMRLKVTSNVNGARVQVSGASRANGPAPFQKDLITGNYTVSISANGYVPQSRAVNLQSAQNLHFNLEFATVSLNVSSNVPGAKIQVNMVNSKDPATFGSIPFQKNMVLGSYSITVSAGGYTTQTKQLELSRDTNFHFELIPAMGKLQVVISPDSLNKRDIYARDKILIIDNGIDMEGLNFELRPGQHTIQIISGGLWTQTTINVVAGKTYTIKPVLSFEVSK